ncbi:MAG: hypothetical protein ABI568_05650 [Pseudarthrobacter sp.]
MTCAARGFGLDGPFRRGVGNRWLEWGLRAYRSFLLDAALVLFGIDNAATGRISRITGYLMGFSVLACLVQGWISLSRL